MNQIAENLYGSVEILIDLNFADAYAVVKKKSKNGVQKKADRTVVYKKSDVIVNKNGTFKYKKYHKHEIGDEKIPDVPWYLYLSDGFFRDIEKGETYFTDINFDAYDLTDKLAMFEIDKPRIENLVFPNFSEHLFKRYRDNYPLSSLYILEDFSMLNNMELKLDEAYEHLKKHPYVKKIEKIYIPYYNVEPGRDKGLKINVFFPQDVHDKLWKKVENDEFACCRIKDLIQSKPWMDKSVDPLGIRKFQRTKDEKDQRRGQYDTEEND